MVAPVLIADRFKLESTTPLVEGRQIEAFDTLLERAVAVSIFPTSHTVSLTEWARQVQALEAEAMLVPEQVGLLADGRPYVVQAAPFGETLDALRHKLSGAQLALTIADAIAALADLHGAGIAHGAFDEAHVIVDIHEGRSTSYLLVKPPASAEAEKNSSLMDDLAAAHHLSRLCLGFVGRELPSNATLTELEVALRQCAVADIARTHESSAVVRGRFENLLRATIQVSGEVQRPSTAREVGAAIAALALEVVNATESFIFRRDNGKVVRWVATHDTSAGQELSEAVEVVLDDGTPRMVLLDRGNRAERRWAMLVPLAVQENSSVLVVTSASGEQVFDVSDLDQLGTFAATAGLVLAGKQKQSAGALDNSGQEILEQLQLGVLTIGHHDVVTTVNTFAAEILRARKVDLVGRSLREIEGAEALARALSRGRDANGIMIQVPTGRASLSIRGLTDRTLFLLERVGLKAPPSPGTRRYDFNDIIGASENLQTVLRDARMAAGSDVPVLITGESGTGKEMVAQAIHGASDRGEGPFIALNVTAIPSELLESELFGYERGAFTGARNNGMPGKFELAQGGTLLLDEIGDMPFLLQAKLLRVLQERRVQRLGSTRDFPVDVRVISTTHSQLLEAVEAGNFRLDLYYRLCVVHLHLPALRDRIDDLDALLQHHLASSCARVGRPPLKVANHVMQALRQHSWPGNIREVANMADAWASLSPRSHEWLETLPRTVTPSTQTVSAVADARPLTVEPLASVERRAIYEAIEAFDGNLSKAARALGVSRGTLYNKLSRYREGGVGNSS